MAALLEYFATDQNVVGSNPLWAKRNFLILISELVFIKWTIRLLPMYEKMQTHTEYEWSDN